LLSNAESSPDNCKITGIRPARNERTPKKIQNKNAKVPCPAETGEALDPTPLNYQFGEFTLDLVRGCLLRAGDEVRLRPKVYEILGYLVEHCGRLIAKQELMQAIWPDSAVTDDSLVQCALELRRALDDRSQQLFKTVPRRGYLFIAAVVRVARSSRPAGGPDPCATMPGTRPISHPFGLSDVGDLPAAKVTRKRQYLPNPRTSLIGREQELADATGLLLRRDIRLLTINGPGGAGKTRLAIAVAAAIADSFTAGVQFIGLASITDPDLVATTIADALEIQQVANRTIPQLIGDQLQNSGPFLLVLDNFEHVLPAGALVAETLEACPSLKILVTSRSCLRVYGEQEFPVTALAQPSAIRLFAQRAEAVRPDFAITPENASAVQEICLRLDGLPLAIELAAARTRVLSPKAILDRLQSRLQLLTRGPLDLPERQQTLRNAIDWSHGLLSEPEARLFRRLAVFVGGCTLESAEAVCNTSGDLDMEPFEALSSLVDKNLLQRVYRAEAEPRFAMLETIREYALERLAGSGEEFAARQAHAAYCLVLAEEGNPELSEGDRARWLAQCDVEIDNFRLALDWLFHTRDLDWALRLCVALFRFWDMREYLTEGRARLIRILYLAGDQYSKERARVSFFIGATATAQGDYPAAENFLTQSLHLYEELGDEAGIAASLNALGVTAMDRGDYSGSQKNLERSLACWRMLSNPVASARCLHNFANVAKLRGDYPRAQWALHEATRIFEQFGDRRGAAWSINQLGDIERTQGDMVAARFLYERALSAFREVGDPCGSARSLTDLAYIDCAQGDHIAAHAASRESLQIFAALGHRRGIARALEGSAYAAIAQGHAQRALKLAAAAAHLRESISARLHQAEQFKLDLLPAWATLSDEEGKRAWAEGCSMSLEDAIHYSLAASACAGAD
jgi:predicted ATPase/DNA-binding winged helix-turn-helix (wHTH) protein